MSEFELPKNKKYQVILADPPWKYTQNLIKDYKVMKDEEICAMNVQSIAEKNSVLCLWATGPKIPSALNVMKAWGFEYRTQLFTWVKSNKNGQTRMGLGNYTRGQSEIVFLGVRGKGLKRKRNNIRAVFHSQGMQHSRKPDEIRELIVDLFGVDTKRIELFARSRSAGWEVFGNQTNKFSGPRSKTQSRITEFCVPK
jgi:N6-adenosine-specific RNA methylase IME4